MSYLNLFIIKFKVRELLNYLKKISNAYILIKCILNFNQSSVS